MPRALLATWRINEYRLIEDRVTRDLSNSEPIRLRFNADTTWTLQVSSGQTTGPFRTDSWTIRFNHGLKPMDRFGSPDDRRLLESLREVVWYEVKGDELTLYFSEGAGFISCRKVEPEAGRIDEHLCQPWKLVGFGHTADGSLRELTGADRLSNKTFLVELQINGMLYTLSSSNELYGNFSMNGQSIRMNVGGGTKVGETKAGEAYVRALNAAERFELQKDGRLKLFYNQGRDYLLFREGISIISSTPPAELLGKWVMADLRLYAMPPRGFKLSEQTVDFRSDGFVYITGTEPFGTSLGNKLPYGYRPWGNEDNLLVGYMYFSCRIDGDELRLGRNSSVDGPVYVFKRLRK